MSPVQGTSPIALGTKKYNIAEEHDMDCKITPMNISKDFKGFKNKTINNTYENASKQWNKIDQDTQIEMDSINNKSQSEWKTCKKKS